jgi:Domain of unknown function (DUF4139)
MRRSFAAFLVLVLPLTLLAQTPKAPAPKRPSSAAPTAPSAAHDAPHDTTDLPVRKVVLYKNGVGYFEHAGAVNGNQRVTVDFTSAQLNDVLQSLTALDSKGGMIGAVGYNSTMPIAQQLTTLALGLKDYPATLETYHAIRGQRVEVTGAGAPLAGRLVNVEYRKETDKNGETSEDHYFLIVETDTGALRTAELTDAVAVRMVDPSLQKQFASYLEIIASAQDQQLRHLTLEDRGQGERQLQVSYISEVPVWKSTYRVVFPRDTNGNATVQGWAVVDNTVGVDWDSVQLSLVAGAPQSFIQPLSQPIYTNRPTIPIATVAQNAPITHEAADGPLAELKAKNQQRDVTQSVTVAAAPRASFGVMGMVGMGSGSGGGMGAGSGNGYGPGSGDNLGGGVYRASDAINEGDVSTNAFDDFFEYALTQPVTIHKNESAMVPILQQELPATHVTLWSDSHPTPLRAIWLENTSKLTFDSGSFSIFESGEFAGEGLLDPIHPGEKRLLSYAVDQAVKVRSPAFNETRKLNHIAVHNGVMVQTSSEVTENTYTIANAGDEQRSVVVEHRRRNNAELDSETKPEETTATTYRFKVNVGPHQVTELHVKERANQRETVEIGKRISDGSSFLVTVSKYSPELEQKLQPVIAAAEALDTISDKLVENDQKQEKLNQDEARVRENVTALKGNDAAKRFVDELNQAEDELQATKKEHVDLQAQRDAAQEKLDALIANLSFDTDLDVVLSKTP